MTFSSITKLISRRKKRQLQFIETLLCGIAGGILFTLLHLPLLWMLGPLTAVLIWKLISKRNLYWPVSFKNGGQMLLGYSMGLSFTIDSARQIANQLPSMAIVTVLMVVFGLAIAYFVSRLTGINIPSAVMGTTPGGLSQMVVLSEEIKGADSTIVTFMQTIRMLTVIFVVPTLSIHAFSSGGTQNSAPAIDTVTQVEYGSFFQFITVLAIVLFITTCAVRFKCPTPWIIGPLLSSAILTVSGFETPQLPPILIVIAQLCLGIYLGLGIKINMLRNWRKLLPFSLISGLLIVGFALVLSYVLHIVYPVTMTTAFLCIAPGGLPEMGVTAHTVHADVSMVAAYQLFRVFFILFIVPIFLRYIFGRQDVLERSVKSL
ncbi:AbrB family transcriptional regulator [Bacillus aerolatus]|uniref:AbrB family transcriptional regulator n=1 Tax=Bacillus aerolatus TaxID=2653354 RepID=A0A6I1FDW0_9BACI|nr:AbrB family transcriptional regulator [Bacillus aerolatus]KAB7705887.1 AbrB family transcriptional regulator [Bacillus aerolatus]